MHNKTILISGAGIAGPALAYWLHRHGFAVTVVERAPALREGGQAVDFRGEAHLTVLRRMGVLEEIRAAATHMGEQTVVDAAGRKVVSLPAAFMSGDVEIRRGDLSRILYERTRDTTEYVFGDWITSLTETASGVHATFAHGEAREFDLVVGADGLHSGVRALVFGEESRFVRPLGYHVGAFSVPNHLNLDRTGLIYNEPGRGVILANYGEPGTATAAFFFETPPLSYDRHDVDQQKKLLMDAFVGVGWETSRLLSHLPDATDLYFDAISQVHMDRFTRGRVALVGDAGYGATLGGLGTGLAVVSAYVLAGELAVAAGDHRVAFPCYEEAIRGYAEECRKVSNSAGPFLAPPSRSRLWFRNAMYRVLSAPAMSGVFTKLSTKSANAITFRNYPL
ncbi:2-polyprenyl-6-methoxyphenol hydroxylase [Streptoalloteichus tenebrarius]|uniref:2-polyprenyl-6-methoxyphenol hydroxylase n=1 Tax=Streptoalloteichus tenebrarius (strain ATCC 17920 / DSM 40477 / JCM 4838 / CBS 697.72 / NBRC 16177 / NCIMB 11028 / NRRL B-12390 / A12253. 1 / ISP 5477) TaxID=1933 RepID=A0ABT1HUI8_STRSD|nr:FAD-dependent monooxygenase [Streptoalloteichus tenebrarius]MCP2259187.1 2-polyprenyl-6-methoxyphenol hydroxylase [Streptoalloteichus tenebrarius]BFF04332.1 FAD-dependent monooxygenase [Streptoalloteichus tenebrarius]